MAILVVRILPNEHPTDTALTPLRTAPGDVVEIVEDDHQFSQGERNCGHYRFITVAGIGSEQFLALKASRFDVNGNMTRRRDKALDSTVLQTTWVGQTTATKAQVDAITITRA